MKKNLSTKTQSSEPTDKQVATTELTPDSETKRSEDIWWPRLFLVVKEHPSRAREGISNAGEILCEYNPELVDNPSWRQYAREGEVAFLITHHRSLNGWWCYGGGNGDIVEVTYEQASNLAFHEVQRAFYKD